MRDDLLPAQASVNWAISQFEILDDRIKTWRESRPYVAFTYKDPETGNESWRVKEQEPLPLIVNAEVGAIINSLRSSLDILVNALAERHGDIDPKDVRFPFSDTPDAFFVGKHSGRKAVKRLSAADQAAIEKLQPYHGGHLNNLLWTLHNMDIVRKHRRLVKAESWTPGVSVYRAGHRPDIDAMMGRQPPPEGYILARNPVDPNYNVEVRIAVTLPEAGPLSRETIIEALREFANASQTVINLFDT
jgi:hypothetical protein